MQNLSLLLFLYVTLLWTLQFLPPAIVVGGGAIKSVPSANLSVSSLTAEMCHVQTPVQTSLNRC